MTPDTTQRTAFHENGGAYAWPVIDGVSVDVEKDD
jgi:hypothetical protein